MKRAALLAAAALATALAVVGVTLLLRGGKERRERPSSRLPGNELVAALEAADLGARLQDLARFPCYRAWFAARGPGHRWAGGIPSPLDSIGGAGPGALGLYPGGWILVTRDALGPSPALPGRLDPPWRITASCPALLAAADDPPADPLPAAARGGISAVADLASLASAAGFAVTSGLPRRAEGSLSAASGRITERWILRCEASCALDLLDPAATNEAPTAGWAFVPEETAAVTWFRIVPSVLFDRALPLLGAGEGLVGALDRAERFLGIPLRSEIAASLRGTGLVAMVPPSPGSKGLEPLVALDLARPEKARRLLNRLAALGMLTGAGSARSHRGVAVARWGSTEGRRGFAPSAAVDGEVLLLSSSERAIDDAIDRRRDGRASPGRGELRSEVDRLGPGSWKAVSRSASLTRAWEALAGGRLAPAGPVGGEHSVTARVFAAEGTWIVEGGGSAPAFAADSALIAMRGAARFLRGRFADDTSRAR